MSAPAQEVQRSAVSCLYKVWSEPDYPFAAHTVEVKRDGTVCRTEWSPRPGEPAGTFCISVWRPDGTAVGVADGNDGPVSIDEIRLIADTLLTLASQAESNHPQLDAEAVAIKAMMSRVRGGRPETMPID